MSRSSFAMAFVAMCFSAIALYAVLANPASAENAVGKEPLKVAVVDFNELFSNAKITKDRQLDANEIIKNIYGDELDSISKEGEEIGKELDKLMALPEGERNAILEEDYERKLKVLEEKGKALQTEAKAARSMLIVRFEAHAKAGVFIEIESYAKRNSIDLVMNRSTLMSRDSEDSSDDSASDERKKNLRFSANVSNSTLLYFNGKDDENRKKKYTIADITKDVAENLKVAGWAEMKDNVLTYLDEK